MILPEKKIKEQKTISLRQLSLKIGIQRDYLFRLSKKIPMMAAVTFMGECPYNHQKTKVLLKSRIPDFKRIIINNPLKNITSRSYNYLKLIDWANDFKNIDFKPIEGYNLVKYEKVRGLYPGYIAIVENNGNILKGYDRTKEIAYQRAVKYGYCK